MNKIFLNFPHPCCGGSGPACITIFLGPQSIYPKQEVDPLSRLLHSEAKLSRVTDRLTVRRTHRQTDKAIIGNNNLHFMHSRSVKITQDAV